MRKCIFLLAGIFTQFFANLLFAQPNNSHDETTQNSLLWKISGKDLSKPSYLFGTMHMICNDDYFFYDHMNKAFNESEKLVMEIDLSDPNTLIEYQKSMMLPEGKVLKDFFENEKDYQTFSDKLKEQLDIDLAFFQHLKPFILLSSIAQKSFSCSNTSSYEMNFMSMAKQKKIPIAGLETGKAQMQIFDEMKDSDIREMLTQGLSDRGEETKQQDAMIAAYKLQDIAALHQLIFSAKDFERHEAALIDDRNRNWVELLPDMMRTQSCFIAVGAGHLAGENGVLRLLKQKGYALTAITR